MNLSPLNKRRLNNFIQNKRGLYSFWVFTFLFVVSLFADFIANEKPLLIKYNSNIYFPIFQNYPETIFGGDFETEADYRDPYVIDLIESKGWLIMPIIPYSYHTIIRNIESPAPSPPSVKNWLGTDDQARDVLSRLIYGFRISILFGFTLTFFSMIIGVTAGAIQGYFGGKTDLFNISPGEKADGVSTIDINDRGDKIVNADGSTGRPAYIGLAHELIHLKRILYGETIDPESGNAGDMVNPDDGKSGLWYGWDAEEIDVRYLENIIRNENNYIDRAEPYYDEESSDFLQSEPLKVD